jgi:hypothetical protein
MQTNGILSHRVAAPHPRIPLAVDGVSPACQNGGNGGQSVAGGIANWVYFFGELSTGSKSARFAGALRALFVLPMDGESALGLCC